MVLTAAELISRFQLLPHPEGGYYRETYRSTEEIRKEALPGRFTSDHSFATAIYFLLEKGNFSAFHRIRSDESWHFYAGEPLHIHIIHPDGNYELIKMGNLINDGCLFQYTVPAGAWFASETAPGGNFSFTGCTVSPGFDFEDFELADRTALKNTFPHHATLIERLCRQ